MLFERVTGSTLSRALAADPGNGSVGPFVLLTDSLDASALPVLRHFLCAFLGSSKFE